MTQEQIHEQQRRDNAPYDLALKIRALLDQARDEYGKQMWCDDEVEVRICELVFED